MCGELRMSKFDDKLNRISNQLERIERKIDKTQVKSRGNRTHEMANWIESIFKDRKRIPVWKVMRLAQQKGYSLQMIQKVRRENLADRIYPTVSTGKGWAWEKLEIDQDISD